MFLIWEQKVNIDGTSGTMPILHDHLPVRHYWKTINKKSDLHIRFGPSCKEWFLDTYTCVG